MAQTSAVHPKILAHWLFLCAGLVMAMILVGAVTRLTESGLSMVEWRPLIGMLPPLNEAEWTRVFGLYQQSPEFQKINFWMGLEDFKLIFFWEWFHRFLGRFIGLAFGLPLLVFWLRGMIPEGYGLKLLGIFILGGLQGFMGWYMVQSGLIDIPAVSHFRLAAHLALAFLIFALLVWLGFEMDQYEQGRVIWQDGPLAVHLWLAAALYVVTFLWGAFTAGLDAGLIYNDTFPHMGKSLIPENLLALEPAWRNFIHNPASVQFIHRWLALMTGASILSYWLHGLRKGVSFAGLHLLGLMVFVQIGLGIATLFSGVFLPLATAHQMGAVLLLLFFVMNFRTLRA